VAIAPHCPLGPISLAAALQIDFSCINALIQETSLGIHYNEEIDLTDYLKDPEVFGLKDGYVSITPLQTDMTNHSLLNELSDWSQHI
jgi:galactonate dehydratase